jgi:hypothetical protein
MSVSETLLWCVAVAEAVLLLALYRSAASLKVLPLVAGNSRAAPSVPEVLERRPVGFLDGVMRDIPFAGNDGGLWVFASPSCQICHLMLESLAATVSRRWNPDRTVFILRGDDAQARDMASRYELAMSRIVVDPLGELSEGLNVSGNPFMIAHDGSGRVIRAGVPASEEAMEEFLGAAAPSSLERAPPAEEPQGQRRGQT